MRHTSISLNQPIELVNITSINPLISKCVIKVCYVGELPNRNNTIITKETALGLAQSLPGSPIVGFYSEEKKDFLGHEKELIVDDNGDLRFVEITRPYGFVDLQAKVWFEKFLDDGMVEREYLCTEGYLWTGQYPECQRVITQGDNQSMELDKELTKATRAKVDNSLIDFFIINEAVMSKLCILGEDTEPCFEGAGIKGEIPKIQFSFEDDFKNQLCNMMNEIREFMLKGGKEEMSEENKVLENEGKIDETVENNFEKKTEEEICPKCGKEVSACECEPETEHAKKKKEDEEKEPEDGEKKPSEEPAKEEPKEDKKSEEPAKKEEPVEEDEEEKKKKAKSKYNLVEESELSALQEKYDGLSANYEALQSEIESLREFKKTAERKDKQAMIDSFTMLGDTEKADVVENIDKYSVDEIEAKLAVVCLRNKISFSVEEETKANSQVNTSFNLSETQEDDLMPAWVKAVKATKDSENQ